jgi:hypothetical protein
MYYYSYYYFLVDNKKRVCFCEAGVEIHTIIIEEEEASS